MPIRMPYGNAFLVETPALDKFSDRMYQEERQRDLERRQEMTMLDNLVNREVGKMRSADTGDFIRKYQEYKGLKQQLYRDRKLKNDPIAFNDANQAATQKLAEAMQLANQSAEIKDQYRQLALQRAKDPNSFEDNFLDMYATGMNTPLSSLYNHPQYGNLGDANTFAYKGGNTDFSKAFKAAEGSLRDLNPIPQGIDPQDKFKDVIKTYKGTNDPYEYYSKLIEGVYGSKRARDFPIQNKYTPEQEQEIEQRFHDMVSDPDYKKIYGLDKQDFPTAAYTTELGRAARLKAMEYALNAKPSEKIVRQTNLERQTADRQKFAMEQQARAHKNSLARLYVLASIKDREPEAMQRNIDGIIAQHIEDARINNGEVMTDAETYKSITGQDKTGSSFLKVDENGNYTYGKKITNEDGSVTEKVSGNIPLDAAKIKLTKTYRSGLDRKFNTGEKKIDINKTYKLNGKTFTLDQIKKAAQASGMNVDEYIKKAGIQ